MLTLTWDNHSRLAQADQNHAYDDGDTGLETGQQTVVEWRFGATAEGPWGDPTFSVVTLPNVATYEPPADGWVQITVYSIRDGVTSMWPHVAVVFAVAGELYLPGSSIVTEAGDGLLTEDGNSLITE